MEYRYEFAGKTALVRVEAATDGYIVTVDARTYDVTLLAARGGELALEIDGHRRCLAYVALDGSSRWVALAAGDAGGRAFVLTVPEAAPRPRHGQAGRHEALQAQMPGIVRRVLVVEGQAVTRGQALVLLEAMKMEIRVTAPEAGVVRRVAVQTGESVERGQALVELDAMPDQPV